MPAQQAIEATSYILPEQFDRFREHIDSVWVEEAVVATGLASIRRRRLPADQVIWLVVGHTDAQRVHPTRGSDAGSRDAVRRPSRAVPPSALTPQKVIESGAQKLCGLNQKSPAKGRSNVRAARKRPHAVRSAQPRKDAVELTGGRNLNHGIDRDPTFRLIPRISR